MTREQAKERNFKIFRLRGIISLLPTLIPEDVYKEMFYDKEDIETICKNIKIALNKVKKIEYICEDCGGTGKVSRSKSVLLCDKCGRYGELYRVKNK